MLNYSIRPVLWTHKKTNKGLCPLKICITINRERAYIKTPYKLRESQFENGKVIGVYNADVINAFIRKEHREIEQRIFEENITSIKGLRTSNSSILLDDYAKLIRYDKTRVTRITNFYKNVRMIDIDLTWIRAFEAHERRRGSHPNTIHSTIKYLNQLLRQAENEGLIKSNPMKLTKVPKYVKPEKDFLTKSQIIKLWDLLEKPLEDNTRSTLVYFLLACYTGLRHSDWKSFDPYTMCKDGFLSLRAHKNKQDIVIPVGPSLDKIINLTKMVAPALSNQKCNVHLKAISIMADLGKKITCHTARHTAGNLFAASGLNISIVAKLLAISENTAKVYFHYSGADITNLASNLKNI